MAEAVAHLPPQIPGVDLDKAPVVIFWELTRACALACAHCRAKAQPKRDPFELSMDEARMVIKEIASFTPKPILVLTGGDPLMRRDFFDIASLGVAHGLHVSLSPSVTALLNPANLRRTYASGVRHISISLDGATSQVHDWFRGVQGSHLRTLKAVADARDAGLSVQINTTVSRRNLDELDALASQVGDLRAILWDVFFLVPTGRAQVEDVLSAEQHESVYNWLYGLQPTVTYRIKTTLGQPFRRVSLQRAEERGMPVRPSPGTNDGKGICFISHTGQICPSGFLPIVCGNVKQASLVDIYRNHSVFTMLRNPSLLQGKCGRCPYNQLCGGCRARAYAISGDFLAPEPTCSYQPVST